MPVPVPALIGTTYALNPHSGKAPPGMKEISMGGTNTKALAVPGTKAPAKPRRSNPAGGWMETLVTYIVPTLTGGLLGALNGMNPDWWRDLALHWKGVIMTVISGGARWWESESKRSKDLMLAAVMHDLAVAAQTYAVQFYVEAGIAKAKEGDADGATPPAEGAEQAPPGDQAAQEGMRALNANAEEQVRALLRALAERGGGGGGGEVVAMPAPAQLTQGVNGFNMGPGLDRQFAQGDDPRVLQAIENLRNLNAA